MRTVWDILHTRGPLVDYAAPPVCEVIFSGSSSPIIILSEEALAQVSGLTLGGVGGFQLSWNVFPGAICYNVYFIGGDNVAVLLAQCISDPTFLLPDDLDEGSIIVTAITPEGETPPSDPITYPATPSAFWQLEWVTITESLELPPASIAKNFGLDFFDLAMTKGGSPVNLSNTHGRYAGTFQYTGPARSCNLHLIVSGAGTGQPIEITVFVGGNPIIVLGPADSIGIAGTYDFPFIVPASVSALVDVGLVMTIGSTPAPTALSWVGQFSTTD